MKSTPKFSKVPKFPSIIATSIVDIVDFITWNSMNGSSFVGVFVPNSSISISLIKEYIFEKQSNHLRFKLVKENKDRLILVNELTSEEIHIVLLSGRAQYLEYFRSDKLCEDIQVNDLADYLQTNKIDMLFLCGTRQLGDFPPLSLKSCEIHYVSSPLSRLEFYVVQDRFSRSEQRHGS